MAPNTVYPRHDDEHAGRQVVVGQVLEWISPELNPESGKGIVGGVTNGEFFRHAFLLKKRVILSRINIQNNILLNAVFIVLPSVIMLSVVLLSVVVPSSQS